MAAFDAPDLQQIDAQAEYKFADTDALARGEFTGYGSTFGNVDQGGDVVERGAFAETLKAKGPGDIAMFCNHKSYDIPIGDWLEIRENDRGLVVKGRLDLDDPVGRRVYNAMSKGRMKGLSIGYRVAPGGAEISGRVRRLKALNLDEISVVTFPMNTRAMAQRVKSVEVPTERDAERALRDAGFSRSEAKAIVATGFKALPQRDADEVLDPTRLLAALRSANAAFL